MKISLFQLGLSIGASLFVSLTVKAQTLDMSIGPYHSMAIYKTPRGGTIPPLNDPEFYHNTGFYIKAYEGSLLDYLVFDKKRFGFGEYFRLGAGIGMKYSPVFKHVKDDGSITTGFGGVYGTDEQVAFGPIAKGRLGYLVEMNYGLHFRYKFNPKNNDSPMIGFRIYYALMMNPIFDNNDPVLSEGYFLAGAKSVFYAQKNFSATLEWDLSIGESDDQTHDRFFAVNLKKINPENLKYKGIRVDYVNNAKRSGAYAMDGLCFHILFGWCMN